MTHQDAENDLAVERYLLGELTGDRRDQFEEHLFDCALCAADVKEGVLFLKVARPELRETARAVVPAKRKFAQEFAWLWQGWTLGPALAACLGVIVYQSAVVVPRMQTQMAQMTAESQAPSVLTPLVLANAGARGGEPVAQIVAPRHGSYLLSVDIPPVAGASAYRCSLYSAAGTMLWQVDVPAQQARDAVTIQVPVVTAQEGTNELRIQAVVPRQGGGDSLVALTGYKYTLRFAR